MAILYSYPIGAPARGDLLVGTAISILDDDKGPITKNFSIGSILDLIAAKGGLQNLQQVSNTAPIGITTTELTLGITGGVGIKLLGTFKDKDGDTGTAGQLLSSTATGTDWIDVSASGLLTDVTATLPILSNGGASVRDISINTMGVANASTAGSKGAVPPSLAGDQLKFLRADATWQPIVTSGNFYLTGLAFATATGLLTATVTGASSVTVDLDGRYMSSLTTTGTGAAAFTQATGVLNIPTPVIPFTSLTTTGSGAATLNSGVLNIPTPTFTEVDTLATVTGRGASTTVASTFSGGINSGVLNVTGEAANGYLYVTGNSQTAQPNNVQGMAFSYNNDAGLRENELFWNPGIQTAAENDTKSFIIINEYLDSANSNARVTASNLKLYGTGVLELTKPNASLVTPHFSSPIVAGTNNSLLARSNTKQTAFTTTLTYNETNATLAILPASGTPSEIQMKSANNDTWKLTISNAGALVIDGPF